MKLDRLKKYAQNHPQYYKDEIPNLLLYYLAKSKFNTFLDYGCGDGSLLNALYKNNLLINKKVFAIDLSKDRIKLIKKLNPNIIAYVDNVEKTVSISQSSIDFLISTQVVEHVDDKKMIQNINLIMKKGGILYLSTVFKKSYGFYFYKNEKGERVLDPTHLREYTKDSELLDILVKNGFILIASQKTQNKFSLIDFIFKKMNVKNRQIYSIGIYKILSKIKIPIVGYRRWEIIAIKERK